MSIQSACIVCVCAYLIMMYLFFLIQQWSYHGPIMEAFLKNVTALVEQMDSKTEASACGDLLINYNNIDKVS